MRQMYLAIRALREEISKLPPELADAASDLQLFESMNRGHQNELDDLAMAAQDRRIAISEPTRLTTFRTSMSRLFSAATRLWHHRASLDPKFINLLKLKDETGFLAHWQKEYLRSIANYSSGIGSSYRHQCSLFFQGTTLKAELCFEHPRLGLKAFRSFTFELLDLNTLEGGIRTAYTLTDQIKKLASDIERWPEFAPAKKQGALRDQIRRKITLALDGLNDEEREWLASNWSQAKPDHLSKSALA